MIALGQIKDIKEAREIIERSEATCYYEPQNTEEWESGICTLLSGDKKTGRRIRIKKHNKNSGEEIVQIFSGVLLSQGRDMYYLLEFRDGYITIYRFPVSIKIIYGFQNMSLRQCS